MTERKIFIDPHVHFWDLNHIRYPWLTPPFDDEGPNGSVEPIAQDYLLNEYLAEASRWDVRGIVHIEAGAHPDDALKETDWLQGMAGRLGLPSAIVAFAALDAPDVEELLAAHAERPNVRGIRHIVNWHPDPARSYTDRDVTTSPAWQEGFGLLEKFGLSFELQAYPGQFPHLADMIATLPNTPVIVNHTGMMTGRENIEEWRTGMTALAALPNVSVKISGMGFAFRPWGQQQVNDYILETIDLFGVDRCMFASDFPTDKLFGSFNKHLDAYANTVAPFTDDERHALFAGNANRIYRLNLEL